MLTKVLINIEECVCVCVHAHSQRAEERCRRHTGTGWLGSGGGLTDVLLSLVTVRRRRASASRHEFGDLGLIFTPGDTFMFASLQRGGEGSGLTCETSDYSLHSADLSTRCSASASQDDDAVTRVESVWYSQRNVRCCGGRGDVKIQYGRLPSVPRSIRGFRLSRSVESRSSLRGLDTRERETLITETKVFAWTHFPAVTTSD